jgi:hypothetical protein
MLARAKAKFEYRLGPAIFGNTLGFAKNKLWRNFHESCKKSFVASGKITSASGAALELKRDRLTVMSKQDVSDLASGVNKYFGESPEVYTEMPVDVAVNFAPQIFNLLKNAEADVLDYYGSYFQPYWILIQRTTPGKTSAASSFGWHIDDNPKELMKLFVYLNDVYESNGAFRAFSWKHSRKILLKGFRSNGETTRVNAQPIADRYLAKKSQALKVLEGAEGTVLAFDNNLVHKGTAPRVGHRHAIQIPIYPSKTPLTLKMVERALLSPRKRDYPQIPESNDFGF